MRDAANPPTAAAAAASASTPSPITDALAVVPNDWALPFPALPPRRQKKRRHRHGWGPFRSVVRERSVDFNLTLDVQMLQQEVQQLAAVRDALRLKTLNLRHAPDGSLMQTVREYFRLFRRGYCVREDPRLLAPDASADGLIREAEQRAFIYSVMDEELDCGNGLYGPQVMVEQISNYSTFLRYISLDLEGFEIVMAEDTVVITTTARLRFQILRATIAMIFPHILGNEGLVARLVGQELAPLGKITFYFNTRDKCQRYVADLDFFGLFFDLLEDPKDVDLLLGKALIADNSMFGVEPTEPAAPSQQLEEVVHVDEASNPAVYSTDPVTGSTSEYPSDYNLTSRANEGEYNQVSFIEVPHPQVSSLTSSADYYYYPTGAQVEPEQPPYEYAYASGKRARSDDGDDYGDEVSPAGTRIDRGFNATNEEVVSPATSSRISLEAIVSAYFAEFEGGLSANDDGFARQSDFLAMYFASDVRCGDDMRVLEKWQALSSAFLINGFYQTGANSAMYDPVDGSFVIRMAAEYRLQCSPRTLAVIFPHIDPQSGIGRILLGRELVVDSELGFWMNSNEGRVTRMTERMDIVAAIAKLIPDPDILALIMSRARLTKHGDVPAAEIQDWLSAEASAGVTQFSF